jgi:hypothetical protein
MIFEQSTLHVVLYTWIGLLEVRGYVHKIAQCLLYYYYSVQADRACGTYTHGQTDLRSSAHGQTDDSAYDSQYYAKVGYILGLGLGLGLGLLVCTACSARKLDLMDTSNPPQADECIILR